MAAKIGQNRLGERAGSGTLVQIDLYELKTGRRVSKTSASGPELMCKCDYKGVII